MRRKKAKGELHTLAISAKQRMKMGYWTEVKELREQERQNAKTTQNGVAAETLRPVMRIPSVTKSVINSDDEILYAKVCGILDNDADTVNPIGQLIDREKYGSLDESGKQRYIVMLAAKYREMAERYHSEKARLS